MRIRYIYILRVIYLRERERARAQAWGGAEGERESISTLPAELRAPCGARAQDPEVVT